MDSVLSMPAPANGLHFTSSHFIPLKTAAPTLAKRANHRGAQQAQSKQAPTTVMTDPSRSNAPRRKRQQVQWVNVNHPEDFRKAEVKKTVRSHAMKDYLSQKDEAAEVTSRRSSSTPSPANSISGRPTRPRLPWIPSQSQDSSRAQSQSLNIPQYVGTFHPEPRGAECDDVELDMGELFVSPIALSASLCNEGRRSPVPISPPRLFKPTRDPRPVLSILPSMDWSPRSKEVIVYGYRCYPQTRSDEWIRVMLSYPLPRSSFVSMAALHKASLTKSEADISNYYALRGDALKAMQEALSSSSLSDETLMCVCMQNLMELSSGTWDGIRHHIYGFEQMVRQRGGLGTTGLVAEIAQVFLAQVYVTACVYEKPAPPYYFNVTPNPSVHLPHMTQEMLESPLFITSDPSLGLQSLLFLDNCSWETYTLLCDMATLTLDLLDNGANRNLEAAEAVYRRLLLPRTDFTAPSADDAGTAQRRPSAGMLSWAAEGEDAIFESVRLTALLYTAAAARLVPLSGAVDVVAATLGVTPATLLAQMTAALAKTDYLEFWGGLASTFLWASLVMAAASHSAVCMDAERPWARVQLCSPVTFCLGLFTTRRADVAFESVKTLTRVQRVLEQGPALV